jgi:regulator of replication initiation timing
MLLFCAIFTPDPDERVREKMAHNYALRLEIQKLRDKLIANGIEVK